MANTPTRLTVRQAADRLNKHERTVWRWLWRGAIPDAIKLGKAWEIPVEAVERIEREGLDLNRSPSPTPAAPAA